MSVFNNQDLVCVSIILLVYELSANLLFIRSFAFVGLMINIYKIISVVTISVVLFGLPFIRSLIYCLLFHNESLPYPLILLDYFHI